MGELINYIEMPLARLDARGKELSEAVRGNYLNPERMKQVQKELGDIAFELWCRHDAGEIEFVNRAGETVPLDVK